LFNAPTTAIAAPYGTACAGSTGTPALTPASLPVLGTTYTLDLTIPGLTAFALIAHGLNNLQYAGSYLPLDLSVAGIAGCQLEVSADLLITELVTTGAGSTTVAIPSNPALTGQELFTQFFALDVAAANGFGAMSNAVHAVLGQ